ncbi:MAG: hypothetical protein A2W90_19580 [Bacteroidetes bacterium GWF2_42_66]|nr:MAG: hypothetical protein A2W92_17900 [Bacteroidetes bacterium GWA2_42_15]OFX98638.1 MAG: hypothetical protein A2W89_10115 [Bacteroidetes bacterium GWE2_42_39]OFY43165.1 MAG: hypothetical protein A2W90_19580 [Bacteroidetes bacterium GWF2_42_66]HBL76982.1 hypothetical protein [Prolixibacteraceae bacterium]HCR89616.1 hypothetical protein [Prolixibacteraceae bacterium]
MAPFFSVYSCFIISALAFKFYFCSFPVKNIKLKKENTLLPPLLFSEIQTPFLKFISLLLNIIVAERITFMGEFFS